MLLMMTVQFDKDEAIAVCNYLRLEANRLEFEAKDPDAAKPFSDLATEIATAFVREAERLEEERRWL